MKKRNLLVCTLFVAVFLNDFPAFSQNLIPQNIIYAPMNATPLILNPAFTGMFNGDLRANVSSGKDWNLYNFDRNYIVSVDLPVFTSKNNSYLAVGLQTNYSFSNNFVTNFSSVASVAYHKIFGPAIDSGNFHKSDLSFGLQGGYGQEYFDESLWMTSNSYQNGNLVGPPIDIPNPIKYYSINAGICYAHAAGSHFNYALGLATYTSKSYEFLATASHPVYIGEAGAEWLVTNRFSLRPEFLYFTMSSARQLVVGNEFHYKIKDKTSYNKYTSVFAGMWYSIDDAIMISSGIEYNKVRIGIGYKHSLPEQYGLVDEGLNISLKYIVPGQKLFDNKRIIPCTRF